jgi:hypothetical protein
LRIVNNSLKHLDKVNYTYPKNRAYIPDIQ